MTQGPWSVKGIDPKARNIARERAHRRGVTLGQYLNSLLLDDGDDAGGIEDVEIGGFSGREAASGDLHRMSEEIDQLSARLEAAQARTSRSMAGIDKSILGLMGKVEMSNKAQLTALERVTRAITEIDQTQTALRSRIDSVEADRGGGANVTAMKSLETSLGRLSEAVQQRLGAVESQQANFRDLFEEKVGVVSSRVDDFSRGLDAALAQAVRNTSGPIHDRMEQIEQQMGAAERRMEGALTRITDAASRFELFETKAERAVGDTTWRMERALETNLTRSRAMSKELLDRVDGIEEKTREGITALGDAVTRITDRLTRAERKNETITSVLERSVSEIDDRVQRIGSGGANSEDINRIQSLFQKRLDALAEDLSRPMHAVRADLERKLEEAARSSQPEKLDRLERTVRQLQDQLQQAENRQATAVETMSAQVERMSRAVDERLRTVETRDDGRTVEDVRREMVRLADTIEARLHNNETQQRSTASALDHLRSDINRLDEGIDDRLSAADKRTAGALEEVGGQVSVVAERMQRRNDEAFARLNHRIDETAAANAAGLNALDFDKLTDRLDERVRDSERRSAEAIGQIGEQVARVADRLQTQHQDALRSLESRLADSKTAHEARLSDVLADMSRRMDEIGEQSANALAPVHKTVSSIAKRVAEIEDRGVAAPLAPQPTLQAGAATQIHDLDDPFIVLEEGGGPVVAEIVPPTELMDVVGVEPPPFDRVRDQTLFEEDKPVAAAAPMTAAPASDIDDLLETDDFLLDAPRQPDEPLREFVAELPDEPRERVGHDYLAQARKAAREGRRVAPELAPPHRKGLGKGPLIASAALAVAVASGGAWTVLRGKQTANANDDFAKLDPAAPQAAEGDPAAAAAMLFNEEGAQPAAPAASAKPDPRNPAAADLFDEPAAAGAKPEAKAGAKDIARAAAPAPKTKTLVDAVNDGDPVALHDYALELLQTGEKARGVGLMKEAANKGLVMAQYRLAKLYEKGEGVPRDMAASRSWTEKAAIGGNLKAMYDLAVFYAEGDAGPQSYAAAAEWFRQAADLGLVDSQFNLAVLYEQGLGVSQDKNEAAYWFEIASRGGDADSGRRSRIILGDLNTAQAEQLKRRARGFNPRPPIGRANGDFGRRAWETATQIQVAEAQRLLVRLGYAPGATDGRMNEKTIEAIKAFEMDNDMPTSGEPSASLVRKLRAATLSGN